VSIAQEKEREGPHLPFYHSLERGEVPPTFILFGEKGKNTRNRFFLNAVKKKRGEKEGGGAPAYEKEPNTSTLSSYEVIKRHGKERGEGVKKPKGR